MNLLTGTVALVTGAGSGLGRELARQLAAEGAGVAAVDVNVDSLGTLAAEIPALAWGVADVTDREALVRTVAGLQERLGSIDLLIANAGVGIETTAVNFRAADIETQVRVNLIGVANSIEAVLSGMLARRRGHLVAISSLASYRGLPRMAGYCASKAGVNGLMDGLRVDLAPHSIAVTTICPCWIRTPLTEKLDVPKPYMLEVEDAARRILDAIRRRRPFYAFPGPAVRRVGLLRWLPCSASDWLLHRFVGSRANAEHKV
jgi:NAD(P)-dependent dehydrogenase (short-subunit alcohol dehydrogenase family)